MINYYHLALQPIVLMNQWWQRVLFRMVRVGLLRNKEKGCELAFEMWGPRALLQAARERVTRNLTLKDWEQHIGN